MRFSVGCSESIELGEEERTHAVGEEKPVNMSFKTTIYSVRLVDVRSGDASVRERFREVVGALSLCAFGKFLAL